MRDGVNLEQVILILQLKVVLLLVLMEHIGMELFFLF